jgi:hypothetical protein
MRDLLLRAKDLFIAAMMAGSGGVPASPAEGWGSGHLKITHQQASYEGF